MLVDTFRTYPYFEMRTQTGKLPMQVRLISQPDTRDQLGQVSDVCLPVRADAGDAAGRGMGEGQAVGQHRHAHRGPPRLVRQDAECGADAEGQRDRQQCLRHAGGLSEAPLLLMAAVYGRRLCLTTERNVFSFPHKAFF